MNNLFQELASRLKTGTVNIAVQMENETMAVMVTFKGINASPRIIRGTAKEIDESFIDQLENDLVSVTKFNAVNESLDEEIDRMIAEKQKKTENKESTKVAADKKKSDKVEAEKNQISITDIPETPAKLPIEPVKKVEEIKVVKEQTDNEKVIESLLPDKLEMKLPFRLGAKDRTIILEELELKSLEVWDVMEIGANKIKELKSCTTEEADESFKRSGLGKEFIESPKGTFLSVDKSDVLTTIGKLDVELEPEPEPDLDIKSPFTDSKDHDSNVDQMKKDSDKESAFLENDFEFDDEFDEPVKAKVSIETIDEYDDDDDFEL